MGKVKSREERNREYTDLFDKIQQENADKKRNQGSPLVPDRDTGYLGQEKLGKSKYDKNFTPGQDFFQAENSYSAEELLMDTLDETRAQRQSTGAKLGMGLGRMGTKTFTEFMKGIGYIGGAIPAALTGDIEMMTNNFFVDAFQNLEDSAKEAMPVYVRDEVENGTFGRQIISPEFWATEGADGLGFLLSAIGTGGIAAGATRGLKVGTEIAKIFGKGAKTANAIDQHIIAGAQTFVESAAETKGMIDGLKADFEAGKQEDGTYILNGKTYTEDEKNDMIGNAGLETMLANMVLLHGPNVLQSKYLFGKGEQMDNIFKEFGADSIEGLKDAVKNTSKWKRGVKNMFVEGGKSAGSEAFQELSQFAIEDYESKKGKGMTDANIFEGILEGMYEGLTTIEGQKSMFLGAVLGLGPGAIGAIKKNNAEMKRAGKLAQLMETSVMQLKKGLTGIAEIDPETGKPKLDENGRTIIDPVKFEKLAKENTRDSMVATMYAFAKETGNVDMARQALTDMALGKSIPFLEVEQGIQIWEDNVRQIAEQLEGDVQSLGFENKEDMIRYITEVGKDAQKELLNIKNLGPRFFGIKATKEQREAREEFIQNVEWTATRLKVFDKQHRQQLQKVRAAIRNLDDINARPEIDTEAGVINFPQASVTEEGVATSRERMAYEAREKELLKAIEENKKAYELLFDQEEQNKAFQALVNKKDNIEAGQAEDTAAKEEQDAWFKALKDKGYTTLSQEDKGIMSDIRNGNVVFEDIDGNQYKLISRWNRKEGKFNYLIQDMKSGKTHMFSQNMLKKLGIDQAENIVPKAEATKAIREQNLLNRHKRTVRAIARTTRNIHQRILGHGSGENRIDGIKQQLDKKRKELEKLQEEIEFFENEVIDEITLEDAISVVEPMAAYATELETEIKLLEAEMTELNNAISELDKLRNEVKAQFVADPSSKFNLNKKLDGILNKLVAQNSQLDLQNAKGAVDAAGQLLDMHNEEMEVLESSISRILEQIKLIEDINSVPIGEEMPLHLMERLDEYAQSRDFTSIIDAIEKTKDKSFRQEVLEFIGDYQDLLSAYVFQQEQFDSLKQVAEDFRKADLMDALREEALLNTYTVLEKYANELRKNYLTELGFEEKYTDQPMVNKNGIEQTADIDGVGPLRGGATKSNPFSSIIKTFKQDSNGNWTNELVDNHLQAKHWSTALMNIPLAEMHNHSVRFVTASQLKDEVGLTPPSNEQDDIYIVIYDKATGGLVNHNGIPVYAGMARTNTYFGDERGIRVSGMPEYSDYYDNPPTATKPREFEGKSYTSPEELHEAIVAKVREDYDKFRSKVLDTITNGDKAFATLTDISLGVPVLTEDKYNPEEVLDIDGLYIADKNTLRKANGVQIDTQRGMVYARLKNGNFVKLQNNKIGDLPTSQRNKYLSQIISLMTMAEFSTQKDLSRMKFPLPSKKGSKPIYVPLVGNKHNPQDAGILDLYINWGFYAKEGKDFGIQLYPRDKNSANTGFKVVIKQKIGNEVVTDTINLSDLFASRDIKNGKAQLRSPEQLKADPKTRPLITFLESKYMNVSNKELQKESKGDLSRKNGFWMPTGYKLEQVKRGKSKGEWRVTLDVKKHKDGYSKMVMKNNLHVKMKPYNEATDKVPPMVSQYVSFGQDLGTEPQYGAPTKTFAKSQPAKQPAQKQDDTGTTDHGMSSKAVQLYNAIMFGKQPYKPTAESIKEDKAEVEQKKNSTDPNEKAEAEALAYIVKVFENNGKFEKLKSANRFGSNTSSAPVAPAAPKGQNRFDSGTKPAADFADLFPDASAPQKDTNCGNPDLLNNGTSKETL